MAVSKLFRVHNVDGRFIILPQGDYLSETIKSISFCITQESSEHRVWFHASLFSEDERHEMLANLISEFTLFINGELQQLALSQKKASLHVAINCEESMLEIV